jgi:hypothetical protein
MASDGKRIKYASPCGCGPVAEEGGKNQMAEVSGRF